MLHKCLGNGVHTSERETTILMSVESCVPAPFMAACSLSAKYSGRFFALITENKQVVCFKLSSEMARLTLGIWVILLPVIKMIFNLCKYFL